MGRSLQPPAYSTVFFYGAEKRSPKELACTGPLKFPTAACRAVVPGGAPGGLWLLRDRVAVTENPDSGARRLELNPGSALPSCVTWGKSVTSLCLGLFTYR